MYLFVLSLILSIIYFIFGWKHNPYGKYKHESYFIKIGLYSTYAKRKINTFLVIFLNQKVRSILNPIRKVSLSILPTTF